MVKKKQPQGLRSLCLDNIVKRINAETLQRCYLTSTAIRRKNYLTSPCDIADTDFDELSAKISKECKLNFDSMKLAVELFYVRRPITKCRFTSIISIDPTMVPSWQVVTELNLSQSSGSRDSLMEIIPQLVNLKKLDLTNFSVKRHQMFGNSSKPAHPVDDHVLSLIAESCLKLEDLRLPVEPDCTFAGFFAAKCRQSLSDSGAACGRLTTVGLEYRFTVDFCFGGNRTTGRSTELGARFLKTFPNLTTLFSPDGVHSLKLICEEQLRNQDITKPEFNLRHVYSACNIDSIHWTDQQFWVFLALFPNLSRVLVDDSLLRLAPRMKSLEELFYYDSRCSRNLIAALRDLNLGHCFTSISALGSNFLPDIIMKCPNLKKVTLNIGIYKVESSLQDQFTAFVSSNSGVLLPELKKASLAGLDFGEEFNVSLVKTLIKGSPILKELKFERCGAVTDLVKFLTGCNYCHQLELLSFERCSVDKNVFNDFLKDDDSLPSLKRARFARCDGLLSTTHTSTLKHELNSLAQDKNLEFEVSFD